MRVLMISHTCQSIPEGQEKAKEIGRMPGVDLTVLAPNRWRHYGRWRMCEQPTGNAFHLIAAPVRNAWVGAAQSYLHTYDDLPGVIRTIDPDIIDLWEEPWNRLSAQVCILRDRYFPSVKIIAETEQNVEKRLPQPFEGYRARTFQSVDFIIGRSSEAVQVARRKGYRGPAAVVPNTVDDTLFRPIDKSQCKLRLGLSGFIVGYAGRLVPEKGLLDLIDAIAFCPVDIRLLLVGGGPLENKLRRRARLMGVASRVDIVGPRTPEELPLLMNAMDVFVLPSLTTRRWKEQFGRVLIEAQSCCVPVIGTVSGAIPDVIDEAGILVPEAAPLAIANAIRDIAADRTLARSMSTRGSEQVAERYTCRRVAERMAAIYDSVIRLPDLPSRQAATRTIRWPNVRANVKNGPL